MRQRHSSSQTESDEREEVGGKERLTTQELHVSHAVEDDGSCRGRHGGCWSRFTTQKTEQKLVKGTSPNERAGERASEARSVGRGNSHSPMKVATAGIISLTPLIDAIAQTSRSSAFGRRLIAFWMMPFLVSSQNPKRKSG